MSIALNKEGDGIEDRRIDPLSAIDEFLTLHHLLSYGFDKILILLLRSEILF